jgi:chromate transporter
MPGPLFSFSAYLGALEDPSPNGVAGAALALVAIYLPSFLVLGGVLPFWSSIRRHAPVQAALLGVCAAVVGVLAAAFWDPILTGSIDGVGDAAFAAVLLVLLRVMPVWAVVPLAALAGAVIF